MIPNQNIKQNYLDKELANNTIINGSLNSETLRLKSSSIEFVVYTILAITFISLIGYYMVNNTNNTLTNIVAIIISLLIVFVISKYIYDNYNKPIKI
jgi:multidrug efflux pump subunit AcrB